MALMHSRWQRHTMAAATTTIAGPVCFHSHEHTAKFGMPGHRAVGPIKSPGIAPSGVVHRTYGACSRMWRVSPCPREPLVTSVARGLIQSFRRTRGRVTKGHAWRPCNCRMRSHKQAVHRWNRQGILPGSAVVLGFSETPPYSFVVQRFA